MSLKAKIKVALDETRLLILGAQVLFGFQLHGVFQEAFPDLSLSTRYLASAGQFLMALALAFLIAPSMQHRIVENGEDTVRILSMTTLFAGMALLPFGISLGLGTYIVFDHLFGMTAALAAGTLFCLSAAAFWYGLGFIVRTKIGAKPMQDEEKPTSLQTKIDQLLTEARLILPGAQALLGFQLTVTLTRAFEQLPASSRLLHAAALCCVALMVGHRSADSIGHRDRGRSLCGDRQSHGLGPSRNGIRLVHFCDPGTPLVRSADFPPSALSQTSELTPKERKQEDNGQGNSQNPQKQSAPKSHGVLLGD
jgi:Family of unknown function (DUF6328)